MRMEESLAVVSPGATVRTMERIETYFAAMSFTRVVHKGLLLMPTSVMVHLVAGTRSLCRKQSGFWTSIRSLTVCLIETSVFYRRRRQIMKGYSKVFCVFHKELP